MSASTELRSLRSEDHRLALRIFLQRSCLKLGVDVLILADEAGEPLAWTRDEVNRRAAIRHAAEFYRTGQPMPPCMGRPEQAWAVDLRDREGYLFAWGGQLVDEEDVHATCEGITRILNESS